MIEVVIGVLPYLLLVLTVCLLLCNTKSRSRYYAVFFILFLFIGFRDGVGWDYYNYHESIELGGWGIERFDLLPRYIAEYAAKINNPQFFFIVTSFFSLIFTMSAIKRLSSDLLISMFIFMSVPIFMLQYTVIDRFMMTLSILFYASTFLFEKKYLQFIFGLIACFFVHKSGLFGIILIIPCLLHINNIVNILIFLFAIIFSLYSKVIIGPIVQLISAIDFAGSAADEFKAYSEIASDSLSKLPYLLCAINLAHLLFGKYIFHKPSDIVLSKLVSIYNFGCSTLLIFSFNSTIALRFALLFLIYYTVLVSYYKKSITHSPVFYAFFLVIFLYLLTSNVRHPDFQNRVNCFLPYSSVLF